MVLVVGVVKENSPTGFLVIAGVEIEDCPNAGRTLGRRRYEEVTVLRSW